MPKVFYPRCGSCPHFKRAGKTDQGRCALGVMDKVGVSALFGCVRHPLVAKGENLVPPPTTEAQRAYRQSRP